MEDAECHGHDLWNLTISEGRQSVHPSGHPISHSTHVGFSLPVVSKASRSFAAFLELLPPSNPFVLGVGHMRRSFTWSASVIVCPFAIFRCAYSGSRLRSAFSIPIVGVRQHPDSFTLVRCSGMDRSEHSPFRIVPQRGQVPENNVKSPRSEYWAVLHEDVARSYFANDPRHVLPHSRSFAGDACTFSGCADVLARKASRYHVNKAAPWSSVKGLNVIPYWERREKAFILSGGKYSSWVGFPLNCTDAFPSKELASKDATSCACEERHFS